MPEEWKKKISLAIRGPNHYRWKGDKASYGKIHAWIHQWKPKPEFCECCKKNPSHDVANISGKYLRDFNDYEWLCRSCHMHKDGRMHNLKQYQNGKNMPKRISRD